jgi:isoquinoline 1-oxidoreductase subunit beta
MVLVPHASKEKYMVILGNINTTGAVGERPFGPIAVAIASATFRLTGKSVRDMPFVLGRYYLSKMWSK